MKKTLLLVGALALSSLSFGQTVNLGGPISWRGKLAKTTIPTEEMPGFDLAAIQAQDEINDKTKAAPWRFGYKYNTDITLENNGTWTSLPGGNRVWRVGIIAEGAMSVNLLFENLHLPEGAHLYLYDADETNRVGAYTSQNNRADGELGTELVHGDHIIVEYFEPAKVAGQGHFTIANVIHGYRSLNIVQRNLLNQLKGVNDSGNCNIDARCPLGNNWDDQIRSAAMIVVGGNGICSGALINNTCDNGIAYFLTANHCLGGSTGNWAFRFNWEVPSNDPSLSCASTTQTNAGSLTFDQTANGATVLVSGTQADHALLQIDNMTVQNAMDWGVFYAGWNNDDTQNAITEVIGVHHPSGDVKKICRADDSGNGIFHANNAGAATWEIDSWEEGVTEPGSSGSPLFDQNGRIIGQLYGGAAACSGTQNNGQLDYYGRLGVSWGLGIGNYLAPNGCGTSTTNDGWDPNGPSAPDDAGIISVIAPTGQYCSENFTPEVTLRNYGSNAITSVTINYDVNGGANNTFNWTGNLAPGASTDVTLSAMTTTGGNHTFNASTSSPNGSTDPDASNDAASSSFSVTVGGEAVTVEISTDCWGYETYWEIEDAQSTVVATGGNTNGIPPGGGQGAGAGDPGAYGNETTITEVVCLTPGCYDFTIYDDYGDGLAGSTVGGCNTDGDYRILDGTQTELISMLDAAFGNSETQNFCIDQDPGGGTGLEDLNAAAFAMYPNPTNGQVYVQMADATQNDLLVTVTDVAGRIVYQTKKNETSFAIELNAMEGTYFLNVQTGTNSFTKAIVLKK